MYFTMLEKALIAACVIMLMLSFANVVMADGKVYTTPTKPVICTNPTTNSDGSAVDPATIVKAIIYVSRDAANLMDYDLRLDVIGGCAPGVTQDISTLTPGVQYYTGGVFVTTGGDAPMSNAVPFLRALPLPNPLIMVE